MVGKREFHNVFYPLKEKYAISKIMKLSLANAFNSEKAKMLSSGNGFTHSRVGMRQWSDRREQYDM